MPLWIKIALTTIGTLICWGSIITDSKKSFGLALLGIGLVLIPWVTPTWIGIVFTCLGVIDAALN